MYEALQLLTIEQFGELMRRFAQLPLGTRFFVGGIPDLKRLRDFYNTDEKFRYYQECEVTRRLHLGRWSRKEEVREQAEIAGYSMLCLAQPEGLYTAY